MLNAIGSATADAVTATLNTQQQIVLTDTTSPQGTVTTSTRLAALNGGGGVPVRRACPNSISSPASAGHLTSISIRR